MDLEKLKYPIGQYVITTEITRVNLEEWITSIAQFPAKLTLLISALSDEQKNWKYRPNGWSIKQVVHHCSDSHLNAFIRFKLALTENEPTIKPYKEGSWAQLIDAQENNLYHSLQIIEGLHYKWGMILKNLKREELLRQYYHPEHKRMITLQETMGLYAWHCNHHLAHVEQALNSKGIY